MNQEAGPRIVLDVDSITIEPGHRQPNQDFLVLWVERNDGPSPSETYTDSVRVTDTQGNQSASDLTCTPLAAGETAMRSMPIRGGLPAGVGATIDIWIAYDLYRLDESPEHHRSVELRPAEEPIHGGDPAGASAKPYPGSALKVHSHGEHVSTWQTRLKELGYDVVADGNFGPGTELTTRQFQLDKGLHVDGAVGQHTWDAAWT